MDTIAFDVWEGLYLPDGHGWYSVRPDVPENNVWTVVDAGGRSVEVYNGTRWANAIGYVVTELPWITDVVVSDLEVF